MKCLAIGQTASDTRTFTEHDLAEYVALAGVHKSAQSDIVPGPLLGAMFSCLLGTRLPGRGTNWLKQRFAFPAPAHVGEEIRAIVEIIRLRPEKDLVNLRTVCANPAGVIVCEGEALVLVKDLE